MSVWRSLELEALFGGSLDSIGITEAAIARLVSEGVPESEQLDFKRTFSLGSQNAASWNESHEFERRRQAQQVGCAVYARNLIQYLWPQVGSLADSCQDTYSDRFGSLICVLSTSYHHQGDQRSSVATGAIRITLKNVASSTPCAT